EAINNCSEITMKLFGKSAVGLDIADHTITVVELRQGPFSHAPVIAAQSMTSLEYGAVDHGKLANRKILTESLEILWGSFGYIPKTVIFGLPEHQVYSSIMHVKDSSRIDDVIAQEAVKTFPIEKDDLAFSYSVISPSRDGADILLYGASKEVMNEWRDFFAGIRIDVRAFDHELLAIERGLFGSTIPNTCCVVDMGAERTKIAIYSKRGLEYVNALDCAGELFTLEISKALELSKDQAEKLKREQGMEPVNLFALFSKILVPIIEEIHTAVSYVGDTKGGAVSSVVLVGGSAQLKGLSEYFGKELGVPVSLGKSFILSPVDNANPEELHYIEAIGLALKGIDPIWEKRHPSLLIV
ncbi:MAG: pilus assembly protein PilM, partial [Candidatus Uhrbacteria bacterium]|nr:pilus assembly protein PilM [Candidatus Uhrbacteria bacterium]